METLLGKVLLDLDSVNRNRSNIWFIFRCPIIVLVVSLILCSLILLISFNEKVSLFADGELSLFFWLLWLICHSKLVKNCLNVLTRTEILASLKWSLLLFKCLHELIFLLLIKRIPFLQYISSRITFYFLDFRFIIIFSRDNIWNHNIFTVCFCCFC